MSLIIEWNPNLPVIVIILIMNNVRPYSGINTRPNTVQGQNSSTALNYMFILLWGKQ